MSKVAKPASPTAEKVEPAKKNGGKREGSGRKAGVPNKVNAELKEAAQKYTEQMLGVLVKIANDDSAPPAARATAANAVLDRGHGKPTQAVEGTGKDGVIEIRMVD